MLIDFGLARAFYTADGHISMRKHQGRAGTARYASMNTHRGLTQSRRDDLESIGYLLVFLHRGRLPWQGVRAASRKEKHLRICEAKARTSLPELCAAMPGMLEYLQYVRNLGFDADPDYEYLRRLFLQQGTPPPPIGQGRSICHLARPLRRGSTEQGVITGHRNRIRSRPTLPPEPWRP